MAVSANSMRALELEWLFRIVLGWAKKDYDRRWATPGRGMTLDQLASAAEVVLGGSVGEVSVPTALPVAETSSSMNGAWWVHVHHRWSSIHVPVNTPARNTSV